MTRILGFRIAAIAELQVLEAGSREMRYKLGDTLFDISDRLLVLGASGGGLSASLEERLELLAAENVCRGLLLAGRRLDTELVTQPHEQLENGVEHVGYLFDVRLLHAARCDRWRA